MTSLKKLEVVNCNLTTLPKNMENLKLMVYVDLSYNKLTEFNVDVKEWVYLSVLVFPFNNVSKYNMKSVWQHSAIYSLFANDNPNFVISNKVEIHMPMLVRLDLRNNSMQLPNKFGKDQFPALLYLHLSGNNLNTFPDNFDTLNNNLLDMYIARCQIYTLPSYLSTFKSLLGFDARDNNISVVDSTFQSIFYNDENDKSKRDDNRRALFSGNPVCHTDINLKNSFSCEKMCSKYCWYKKEEVDQSDGYCDANCNTEECNYDQGDCVDNLQ
jgi:Leucine-rich repeat (LRR) protein